LLDESNGGAFFEARREGPQLRLLLADAGRDGKPDLSNPRLLTFTARGATAPAPPAPAGRVAGPGGRSGRGASPPEASGRGASAQDRQLAALLTSSAWCTFSFSGGSTYSGGSYGNTNTTRAVFRADGIATETSGHELTNSGGAGNVWANGNGGQQARWKVENGMLMLSADGVQWAPQQLSVTYNSNGSPIIKSNGKEYMLCK